MFNTQVITDQKQFNTLKVEWNQLLQQSRTNTIFLTWEWIYTWWEVFGKKSKLFIVTVRDTLGELVGIAPLFIRKSKYYKFPVKEITFIGIGHSDRQDFIVLQENAGIIREIILKIYENKVKWDILNLEQIPNDSLLAWNSSVGDYHPEIEVSSQCPNIKTTGSWETYLKSLSKKFQRDIKHKTNRIGSFGKWEFKVERTISDLEGLMDSTVNIEMKSRKRGAGKTFFSTEGNRNFLHRFYKLCLVNKWLDYSTINIDDMPVAYLLGFFYNNKYYAYNMAFLEDFHAASPGKLLLHKKIRWCFENVDTVKEFDFLRGNTYVKTLWRSEIREHIRIVFFNGSLYSNIIRYIVFHTRPSIKKLLRKINKL